jgi:hypothetical protein
MYTTLASRSTILTRSYWGMIGFEKRAGQTHGAWVAIFLAARYLTTGKRINFYHSDCNVNGV